MFVSGCIAASLSEFYTVEVQPGEDVTLLCSNFSSVPIHIHWFRLANRSNTSCISSMVSPDSNVSFCDGFQNCKFNMTSNTTALFLKIKQVDLSDSGLYFCGFKTDGNPIIVSATYLKVQGKALFFLLTENKQICALSVAVKIRTEPVEVTQCTKSLI